MGNFMCVEEDNFNELNELNELMKYRINLINHEKKIKELKELQEKEWYNNEEKFRSDKWFELFNNKGIGATVFELDSYYHQDIDGDWKAFKRYYERKNNI